MLNYHDKPKTQKKHPIERYRAPRCPVLQGIEVFRSVLRIHC